jgi:PIN domain nuclease of toxin-antitoxin system
MQTSKKLLLDTHAFIWLMEGNEGLSKKAQDYIQQVAQRYGKMYVSAISIWEIGMLAQKKRITLKEPCLKWVQESLQAPFIDLAELSPEISIESSELPGEFHGDPADRIIVATARIWKMPLITRDDRILQYAKDGYVEALKA